MRHALLSGFTALAIAGLAAPAAAQTGGFVSPFVGVSADTPTEENRTFFGAGLGATGNVVGFEVDFGYSPNFFELDEDFGELGSDGSVTTVMGNLLLTIPLGKFRPYGTVGAGLIRTNLDVFDLLDDLDSTDFGVNYGGGAMIFFNDRVGIRGDIRQFRNFKDDSFDDFPDVDDLLGQFSFWRLSGGVTITF